MAAIGYEPCEIAEIEPRFEKRDLNGHDARALIVSLNVARRNLKKGQQAMALAMIYPEPERRGRGKTKQRVDETSTLFSAKRSQLTRVVLQHSRELAWDVLKDVTPLDDAVRTVKAAREKPAAIDCARRRLTGQRRAHVGKRSNRWARRAQAQGRTGPPAEVQKSPGTSPEIRDASCNP
jgi:hypothetical protein